jgi:alpha-tubulin suppressor-like RCC1 family protein
MLTSTRIATALAALLAALLAAAAAALTPGTAFAAGEQAYSFGASPYGQLGRGVVTTVPQLAAVIPALAAPVQVASGREHGLALAGGTVYAWGQNLYGAVGDGTLIDRSVPQPVTGLCPGSAVRQIAAGHYHSLVLCQNGTVQAWGRNQAGQLGDGTSTQRTRPVPVRAITTAVQIAGGQYFSAAVLADGTMRAWGVNAEGELGTGTTAKSAVPVAVRNLPATGIAEISTGRNHTLARFTSGDVWAWGGNDSGQLGDGTLTNRTRPVRTFTGATSIGTGGFHSLAVRADGSLWTWGLNASGQLGNGSTTTARTPIRIAGLTGVASVAGGRDDSFAIRSDGTLWSWGNDLNGQLGDGRTVNRRTPGQVAGVSGVTAVSAGRDFTLVLAP